MKAIHVKTSALALATLSAAAVTTTASGATSAQPRPPSRDNSGGNPAAGSATQSAWAASSSDVSASKYKSDRRCHRTGVNSRSRVVGRRLVVAAVVVAQLWFVARGYWSDHKEFAFQMFPESSTWQADVVRVTEDGRRVPIETPWYGYRWDELVPNEGLSYPSVRRHATAGLDNQLAFLESALDWVADNTPRDRETRYLEATVTSWHNADPPRVSVMRSEVREGID
jgi:hypothetical protein